jgi:lipoyl(octanoyl) transferase
MTSSANQLPAADIIVDEFPHSGVFNMSMDAALLQIAAESERSTVRIYQWSEPTVTVGYFQGLTQSPRSPFPELPVVRRLSGGGAILHDQEITYSVVLPASHPARQHPSAVYEMVHRRIIELLIETGVPCSLRSEFDAMNSRSEFVESDRSAEPFLCFLRKNPNDIVHSSGRKIVGSAQRRRKGVILQHGSIVLRTSRLAGQVLGIENLEPSFSVVEFRRSLPFSIAGAVSNSMGFRCYTEAEMSLASGIADEMG